MASLTQSDRMSVGTFSYADLVDAYNAIPPSHENRDYESKTRLQARDGFEWYGGLESTEAATELLTTGWKDGARKLESLITEVAPPQAKSRRRVARWSDEGSDLNVDRAMRGEWDSAWRTSKRQWTAGPQTITLVTAWGGNCSRDAESLFWQGAAAAVISDALESAGYGVRIVTAICFWDRNHAPKRYTAMVTIKEETEPMRLDSLAATLCHAGVFRTHGFRTCTYAPMDMGPMLGYPVRGLPSDVQADIKTAGEWPETSIVIGDVSTRSECIAAIQAAMAELECLSA